MILRHPVYGMFDMEQTHHVEEEEEEDSTDLVLASATEFSIWRMCTHISETSNLGAFAYAFHVTYLM